MPRQDLSVPGMPPKAPDDVKCENGGKHKPTTKEMKLDGRHIKYSYCPNCDKIP